MVTTSCTCRPFKFSQYCLCAWTMKQWRFLLSLSCCQSTNYFHNSYQFFYQICSYTPPSLSLSLSLSLYLSIYLSIYLSRSLCNSHLFLTPFRYYISTWVQILTLNTERDTWEVIISGQLSPLVWPLFTDILSHVFTCIHSYTHIYT